MSTRGPLIQQKCVLETGQMKAATRSYSWHPTLKHRICLSWQTNKYIPPFCYLLLLVFICPVSRLEKVTTVWSVDGTLSVTKCRLVVCLIEDATTWQQPHYYYLPLNRNWTNCFLLPNSVVLGLALNSQSQNNTRLIVRKTRPPMLKLSIPCFLAALDSRTRRLMALLNFFRTHVFLLFSSFDISWVCLLISSLFSLIMTKSICGTPCLSMKSSAYRRAWSTSCRFILIVSNVSFPRHKMEVVPAMTERMPKRVFSRARIEYWPITEPLPR